MFKGLKKLAVFCLCLFLFQSVAIAGFITVISDNRDNFEPTDLDNLAGWWKAKTEVTTDVSGVTTWVDQSVNSNDAVQSTNAKKPALQTGFIDFDGVDDTLDAGDVATTVSTIFIVVESANGWDNTASDDAGAVLAGANGSFLGFGSLTASITNEVILVFGPSTDRSAWTATSGFPAAGTHIVSLRLDTATPEWEIRLNGGANLTDANDGTPEALPTSDVSFAATSNEVGLFYPSGIREIVLYTDVLSAFELNKVGRYLQVQHGKVWVDVT